MTTEKEGRTEGRDIWKDAVEIGTIRDFITLRVFSPPLKENKKDLESKKSVIARKGPTRK